MINTKRTLVVLVGLTALAASSNATISITPLDSTVTNNLPNEATCLPTQLSAGLSGPGTIVPDYGSFLISSDSGITGIQVGEVTGFAVDGVLTLDVTLDGTSIYSDTTNIDNPLIAVGPTVPLGLLTGTHLVEYTATFTGYGADSEAYLGGFTVDGFEAVPEPASFAAMGIGIIGLIARKRRSSK